MNELQLIRILRSRFSTSDIKDVCRGIKVDYEVISGENKADKARELVVYLAYRDRLPELVEMCKQIRPGVFDFPPQDLPNKFNSTSKVKILFLAANPLDTTRLRIEEESRSIDQALRQTEFRDKFEIIQHWAVRDTDLQSYLLRHEPNIVHFSGHGSDLNEIVLEDESGNSRPVSPRALNSLFSVLKDNIRCVVLNACYSEMQAQAIALHIESVIGMSHSISDRAAISFATAFYQSLGYGRNIKTSFELGCSQIDLSNLNQQDIPKLIALNSNPTELRFA